MEVMQFVSGFCKTEEKNEPIRYFVGSVENQKVLMDLLIGNKVINSCRYCGDDSSSVYFIYNNEIRMLPKKLFDFLIEHGLNAVEIVAPIYTRIISMPAFYSANKIGLTTFYKENDKYLECKLVDAKFTAEDGKDYILIKVRNNKGWSLRHIDKDIEKAELYI